MKDQYEVLFTVSRERILHVMRQRHDNAEAILNSLTDEEIEGAIRKGLFDYSAVYNVVIQVVNNKMIEKWDKDNQ